MTTDATRAYNSAKSQRRRAAEALGLTPVRLWVEPEDLKDIEFTKSCTEAMIDAEVARKHGSASLADLRAMRDCGETQPPDNAGYGKDMPDGYWDDAEAK